MTGSLVIHPVAIIAASVSPDERTLTVRPAVLPATLVPVAILEDNGSLAVCQPVLPIALIPRAGNKAERPTAIRLPVPHVPGVSFFAFAPLHGKGAIAVRSTIDTGSRPCRDRSCMSA